MWKLEIRLGSDNLGGVSSQEAAQGGIKHRLKILAAGLCGREQGG